MIGYQNCVLRIKLSTLEVRKEPLNQEWASKYLGGKGLGIKYLYEEMQPGIDPLSSENKLILMTGPFTGTAIPCSGKLALITKSPATGTILDCSIGGHFAFELKYAGYDAVIIEGKSAEPSYIYIEDNKVEILPAGDLWGKGSHETETNLLEKYGHEAKVLSIGPAGENLLPIACINSDYYRQAGRGGIGAVMGSKNIKAIVLKGTGSVEVASMERLLERVHQLMREDTLTDNNLWAFTDGTPMIVELANNSGILPTNNFQSGSFDGYQQINADAVRAVRIGKKACISCALGCGNYSQKGNSLVEGPEYETLALCGSNCGIADLEAIMEFNRLCDDLGLDTISAGNVTAFAMEMTEKGIKDFGLTFGDIKKYLEIPEKIARREGIGKELALGVKGLANRYGGKQFAMEVKGLEFPGYEPRGSWGMGLAYATSDRGACHMRSWPVANEAFGDLDPFTTDGKAQLIIDLQHYNSVKFSTILCDFWALSLEILAEMLSLVTDEEYTSVQLETIGERVVNISRLFNQREGFDRKDDTLPGRIFNEVIKSGVTAGKNLPKEDFEKMLSSYYSLREWDAYGKVDNQKATKLSI
jgi:aldehyde:ferredoxin oxidoreductase